MRPQRQIKYAIVWILAAMGIAQGSVNANPAVPTHCTESERVIFSCRFKNGKTASLCASPDLDRDRGVMQYRFGVIGKPLELVFYDTSNPDKYQPGNLHPKYWFDWSSGYSVRLPNGTLLSAANDQWNPKNLPKGYSVSTTLSFAPIIDDASIHFLFVSETGSDARFPGARLSVVELVGCGRDLANYRCKDRVIDELYSLKEIVVKDPPVIKPRQKSTPSDPT